MATIRLRMPDAAAVIGPDSLEISKVQREKDVSMDFFRGCGDQGIENRAAREAKRRLALQDGPIVGRRQLNGVDRNVQNLIHDFE